MYKRKRQGWLQHLDFMIVDELSLLLSFGIALWLGTRFDYLREGEETMQLLVVAALVNLMVFVVFNNLEHVMRRGYYMEFTMTLRHVVVVLAISALLLLISSRTVSVSRRFSVMVLTFYTVISYLTRLGWKRVVRARLNREGGKQNILIVTSSAYAREIIGRLKASSYAVNGVVLVDRDAQGETIDGAPVVANIDGAAEYLCRAWVDEVFFFHASLDSRTEELIARCREMALTIHLYVAIQGVDEMKQTIERIAGYEVLTANIKLMSEWNMLLKRSFDIVAGILGSAVALLLMLILGSAICIASPGPILYKQTRIGENGRKFQMYKLRSMYLDADRRKAEYAAGNSHADGLMFKMDFDPRVIGNRILPDGTQKRGIGDFIRRTSLDEFPQFFNVLRGDMSVVGTRPPTVDEWEKYQYRHRARMSVKPGLTGLWQISPNKDSMEFDEVVKLDTEYIANWSVAEDLRIILSTVSVMAKGLKKKESVESAAP